MGFDHSGWVQPFKWDLTIQVDLDYSGAYSTIECTRAGSSAAASLGVR